MGSEKSERSGESGVGLEKDLNAKYVVILPLYIYLKYIYLK